MNEWWGVRTWFDHRNLSWEKFPKVTWVLRLKYFHAQVLTVLVSTFRQDTRLREFTRLIGKDEPGPLAGTSVPPGLPGFQFYFIPLGKQKRHFHWCKLS